MTTSKKDKRNKDQVSIRTTPLSLRVYMDHPTFPEGLRGPPHFPWVSTRTTPLSLLHLKSTNPRLTPFSKWNFRERYKNLTLCVLLSWVVMPSKLTPKEEFLFLPFQCKFPGRFKPWFSFKRPVMTLTGQPCLFILNYFLGRFLCNPGCVGEDGFKALILLPPPPEPWLQGIYHHS